MTFSTSSRPHASATRTPARAGAGRDHQAPRLEVEISSPARTTRSATPAPRSSSDTRGNEARASPETTPSTRSAQPAPGWPTNLPSRVAARSRRPRTGAATRTRTDHAHAPSPGGAPTDGPKGAVPIRRAPTVYSQSLLPARELDRPQHRLRLGDRLAVLVGGHGVGDGPAPGLQVRDAVLDDDGADVDRGVELAGVAQVADRAAVAAALDRLELVDDLHRAHLRRARERPAGNVARSASIAPTPARNRPETALTMCITCEYCSTDIKVLTSTLPYSQTRPRSLRPRSTSIMCSARSFSSASSSASRRASSAASAPRGRVPAIGRVVTVAAGDRDQRLGARSGDLEVAEVEEVHVRARVDRAQTAVDRERVDLDRRRPALRGHDLEGVAGVDVLDDPRDDRLEALPRHVRLEIGVRPRRCAARRAGSGPARRARTSSIVAAASA